jgi:hypothetical protein
MEIYERRLTADKGQIRDFPKLPSGFPLSTRHDALWRRKQAMNSEIGELVKKTLANLHIDSLKIMEVE